MHQAEIVSSIWQEMSSFQKARSFRKRTRQRHSVVVVDPEYPIEQDEDLFVIDAITSKPGKKSYIYCTMKINGQPVRIKTDTGAKCNVSTLDHNADHNACHLASLLLQKSSSVRLKSCLLGISVPSSLVWGEGTADHNANLKNVVERAWEIGMKLDPKKYSTFNTPLEDSTFCACHLASLLLQKSTSVWLKSCLPSLCHHR